MNTKNIYKFKTNVEKDSNGQFYKKHNIIKKQSIHVNSPVKVATQEMKRQLNKESVVPIIEGNCVTGLIYNCNCGNSAEIKFETDVEHDLEGEIVKENSGE